MLFHRSAKLQILPLLALALMTVSAPQPVASTRVKEKSIASSEALLHLAVPAAIRVSKVALVTGVDPLPGLAEPRWAARPADGPAGQQNYEASWPHCAAP